MRYGSMPGQTVGQPPNPATGAPNSDPFNFLPNPGSTGVGSNQYGSLPPWMNTRVPQPLNPSPSVGEFPQNIFSTPQLYSGSPNYSSSGGLGSMFRPIGPEIAPMPPAVAQQLQNLMANHVAGQPYTFSQANPGMTGSWSPLQQEQLQNMQREFVGSFAQGGTVPSTNIPGGAMGPPVYGGSPIPAGSTGVPGYYSPGGAGYGLGVPSAGGGFPAPTGSGFTGAGGGPIQGGGLFSVEQSAFPNVSNELGAYLASTVGRGATPFNLPTQLPFNLGYTQPGQLNAPTDPILQSLHNFYSGGQSNLPGANTLATIANQGISALPEWQSMVGAMGQNIAQNEAQLKEQFGSMGGLAGTPFGNAASNYMQGVTAQQNALLGQLQQQNILQGQIPVAEGLLSGGQQFGQYAQGLAQQDIQNMYNEFLRTRPEYSPLLGYQFGAATTYDPVLNRAGQTQGGALDAILGNLGTILTGAGNLYKSTQTG